MTHLSHPAYQPASPNAMPKADANNLGGVVYYVGVVTAQHLVSNQKKSYGTKLVSPLRAVSIKLF